MASGTRVGDFIGIRHCGGDEPEGVATDIHVCNGLFDFRHVTGNALTSGTAHFMVRVLLDGARVRTIGRAGSVAFETQYVGRLDQQSIVVGAVNIMATGAFHAMRVHHALDEIVALHAVFVRRAIRVMCERRLAEPVFFELPEILQLAAHVKPYGPVIIFAFNRVLERLPLRVALNTGIVRLNKAETGGIDNVGARRPRDMFASRPMALLTTDVPFGHGLFLDVVIDRMAPVTQWPGRAFEIVGWIKRCPPVTSVLHEIGPPDLICDVPLRRQNEVVVTDLLKITLLPFAPIDKCDVILCEGNQGIGLRQIGKNRIGMLSGVANDVGHPGGLPPVIDLRMTGSASSRTHIMRGFAFRLGGQWRPLSEGATLEIRQSRKNHVKAVPQVHAGSSTRASLHVNTDESLTFRTPHLI